MLGNGIAFKEECLSSAPFFLAQTGFPIATRPVVPGLRMRRPRCGQSFLAKTTQWIPAVFAPIRESPVRKFEVSLWFAHKTC